MTMGSHADTGSSGSADTYNVVLPRSSFGALGQGAHLPWQSIRLLLTVPGAKRWALLPVLANVFLYVLIWAATLWWLSNWHWHLGGTEWDFWGGFGGWLYRFFSQSLDIIKWALILPLVFIFCYFTFTSVGMIVASPFHDFLSERVEHSLRPRSGVAQPPILTQVGQMLRNMLSSLRIVLRQLVVMLLVVPFLLIPYVGFLPLFSVTAYFTGLGFLDVAMARHNLGHAQKKPIIRSCRWHLFGIGLAMECMFLIPFMGLFLLPVGVVAGTLLWLHVSARKT